MDAENKVLIEWLLNNLNRLRNSGANWTLTLHGGAGGDIKHEIKTTGELMPARKQRQVLEERQRT